MRTATLFAFLLLLSGTWMPAQQSTQIPSGSNQTAPQSGTSGEQKTIRGCLSGSGTTYTLTDDSGRAWQLQASADTLNMMKEHVGHEVAITGTPVSASASASTGAASAAGTTSSTTNTNTMQVSNLQHIAGSCGASSGGGPGAAAMGTAGTVGGAAEQSMRGSAAGETAQVDKAASAEPAGAPPPVTSQTPARPVPPTNTVTGANTASTGTLGTPANSASQASGPVTNPQPSAINDTSQSGSQSTVGQTSSQSANLPQAASPLPLMGLAGFGLLAGGIAGRKRR